jgi:PAS domain S-box-containing protein
MRVTVDRPGSSKSASIRLRAALLESQRRVLERTASGAPLEEILETLVRLVEEQASGIRCAVLVADAAEERLRFAAGPNIPEDFKRAMEPYLSIAPNMPACGTAAHLRQPVYSRDIATDPIWEQCKEIALRHGFRAAWSTPILSDENRVLGTFAMFYDEPQLPAAEHIQLIDMATQMARVAIEARCNDDLLRMVFDSAPNGILITDLAGTILTANRALASTLGYTPAQLAGKGIAEIADAAGYPAIVEQLLARQDVRPSVRCYRREDGTILSARQRSSLCRDRAGQQRYVLTYIDNLDEARPGPAERLSRRERQVLDLVVSGLSSKEAARRLGLSPASVDTYRSRIMQKLGIENLPGLVRFAIRHGIATL